MKKIKDKLPKKPSKLIRLAVADVKRAKKAGYTINMNIWHAPDREAAGIGMFDDDVAAKMRVARAKNPKNKFCQVCFGGSVLACGTSLRPDQDWDLGSVRNLFEKSFQNKIDALDSFRSGEIADGLRIMGLRRPPYLAENVFIPSYDDRRPQPFFRAMLKMADVLEEFGL
jgi:hypothetical protein